MRIFPPELEIGEYEGFTAEKDIFRRKEFGESLKNLFEKVEDPMVAILDEPWGAGKSTFIKMWCGHMRLHGFPVIYFDAFKHDYSDDAFIAIAGEVVAAAQELNLPDETMQDFIDNAAKTGFRVVSAVGRGMFKRGFQKMAGEEGAEEVSEIINDSAQGAFDGLEQILKKKLSSRREERKSFENFGVVLDSVAKTMSSEFHNYLMENNIDGVVQSKDDANRPLIIVIDELDRCKPTFALDVLEKIKHFFSREGIHFFLITHMKQLNQSVAFRYGLAEYSPVYMEKFYNIKINFPADYISISTKERLFGEYLMDIIDSPNEHFPKSFAGYLEDFCVKKKLHPRSLSKIATRFFLACRTNVARENQSILLMLCLINYLDADLYRKIWEASVCVEDLKKFIEVRDLRSSWDEDGYVNDLVCRLMPFENMSDDLQEIYRNGDFTFRGYKKVAIPLMKLINSVL